MDGYWRGTEEHHKKTEFHVLYSPTRIKPIMYRVQAKGLIATLTVGKEFLKYFSLEDQGEDDFLRLRKKY
jgi:DNA-binding PadR family transcriptional regulator